MNKKVLVSALILATTGFAAAQAPEIDKGRIDSMVNQVLQQAQNNPNITQKPDGAAIRRDVTRQLQSYDILKAEAIKAGLDKDPNVQNQLKNLEAQFYAAQYAAYLERNTEVSDAAVRSAYDRETQMIKLQQVQFDSAKSALDAQQLLLKGLTFDELMKRFPNPEQKFTDFISPQQLPPQLAQLASSMTRGQVTRDPVQINGKFYLFKLADVERNPKAPPFDRVKGQLAQRARQEVVQQKIAQLLKNSGIQ